MLLYTESHLTEKTTTTKYVSQGFMSHFVETEIMLGAVSVLKFSSMLPSIIIWTGIAGKCNTVLGVLYRPPNSSPKGRDSMNENIENVMRENKRKDIVIVDDLNDNLIDTSKFKLRDMISGFGFNQSITEAT